MRRTHKFEVTSERHCNVALSARGPRNVTYYAKKKFRLRRAVFSRMGDKWPGILCTPDALHVYTLGVAKPRLASHMRLFDIYCAACGNTLAEPLFALQFI
jgi:hypothetical protein